MTMDNRQSLLEAFRQTLTDELDKSLIDAFAENLNYDDLERTFLEQLVREAGDKDEA